MHSGPACQDGPLGIVSVDVARARAVSQLCDRVVDLHGPLELGMRHRTIPIGMAAGAIGPEGRELPGNNLGVRRVAARAVDRGPMIHEGRRGVSVGHWCPDRGPVTCLARQRCGEVLGRLAFSHRAVVAADARCGETGVIDPRSRKSHGALVARLTRGIRDDVVRRLSDRHRAVVTAGAVRNDSRVVHPRSGKRHRASVAVLTGCVGGDVICRLAEHSNAIVAGRAAAGDACVARFCIGRGRIW
jgi:hypothetical protein